MFEEGEVIQMKEHLEMSLRAKINAKVRADFGPLVVNMRGCMKPQASATS